MNEFENNNINNNPPGESARPSNENPVGYTNHTAVPQNNLYRKSSDDIIQDSPSPAQQPQYQAPSPQYTVPPTHSPSQNNYNPYQQKANKPRPQKSGVNAIVVIVACVLAAVIGALSGVAAMSIVFKTKTSTTPSNQTESPKNNVNITVNETADSIAEAVATKCTESVVGIRTTTSVMSFFGGSQEQTGDGSGVIYTSDGYIITNYHVISDAVKSSNSKIDVFVGDNKSQSYSASVIGYNISCDLAVIKINATGLTPLELGNSDELSVGQQVITIGAPGGLEFMGSVTYGIISGLDRTVSTNSGLKLIQTDAAINPGNSGGALLDTQGKLIGINSSKIASVEFEGMGFAIPINTVKEKCDKIISKKGDSQAYFGVSVSSTYSSQVLSFYGYPSGAVVSSVAEGSPAEKAGIERGDIITEFNGVEISEYTVLNDALYDCDAGDTVEVTIYRAGKYYTVDIKLTSDTSN